MKILIMISNPDRESESHLYVDGLLNSLLKSGGEHTFILLYRTSDLNGKFSDYKNVKVIRVKAPGKIIWDQIIVPYVAWKNNVDVIFNPTFTIPLISHCPVAMGLREPSWYSFPEHYEKWFVFHKKIMLPLYVRKAAHFYSYTKWVINENSDYIKMPLEKMSVIVPGLEEHFKPVENKNILKQFRAKYKLPDKFILSVTGIDNIRTDFSHKWYASKNLHVALKAFLRCKDKIPHHFVMVGKNIRQYLFDMGFTSKDFERVHILDSIPFTEIPEIFSLADLFIVPSFYEIFGFTILAAMACGCPVVSSNTGAFSELAGDAVLYANPYSAGHFAEKILLILNNEEHRKELKKKGLERVEGFKWDNTAAEILKKLLQIMEFRYKQLVVQKREGLSV